MKESFASAKIIEVLLTAAFNLIAPRPVAVLTTVHRIAEGAADEYFAGMPGLSYDSRFDYDAAPMSTLTLLGKTPPIHTVSISPSRKSYRNLLETRQTVANFLWPTLEDAEKMYVLSDGSYHSGNAKIKNSGFTLEDSLKLKVPRIREAMAWIEYELIRMIEIPETERPIFLLKPVAAYTLDGVVDPRTFAFCTLDVPMGHLGANVFSGGMHQRIVANRRTGGREFTLQEHWDYSTTKK